MARGTRSRRGTAAAAFTLVELLLTVALMLLLAGAVIINFGSLDRNARLEEGASQVETLFRYARAQAASTGRQVRIVFGSAGPDAGGMSNSTNAPPVATGTNIVIQVLWEPEPVDAPGRFQPLPGVELLVEQVNDLVTVREIHQPGDNSSATGDVTTAVLPPLAPVGNTNSAAMFDPATTSPSYLACYPDGSSDSLELVLAAVNGEDKRLAVVTLSGLNGKSRHHLITPDTQGLMPPDLKAHLDPPRSQ